MGIASGTQAPNDCDQFINFMKGVVKRPRRPHRDLHFLPAAVSINRMRQALKVLRSWVGRLYGEVARKFSMSW